MVNEVTEVVNEAESDYLQTCPSQWIRNDVLKCLVAVVCQMFRLETKTTSAYLQDMVKAQHFTTVHKGLTDPYDPGMCWCHYHEPPPPFVNNNGNGTFGPNLNESDSDTESESKSESDSYPGFGRTREILRTHHSLTWAMGGVMSVGQVVESIVGHTR